MATRTLIIDLTQGSGNEPMYGVVTVQRIHSTTQGNFEVLPWETTLKLVDGKATIEDAVTDGTGPIYNTAYLIRVMNGYCAPRWGFMAALPDGDTPITTGEMPKVNPLTGEGVYMDAQEWNALYGQLPDRVSALETSQTAQDTLIAGKANKVHSHVIGDVTGLQTALNTKGNATLRVDTTVGKRVFISDGTAEHMISGDTGTRLVKNLLLNGATTPLESSPVYLRRVGDEVSLYLEWSVSGWVSGTRIMNIPTGFLPFTSIYLNGGYPGGSNSPFTVSPAGLTLYANGTLAGRSTWKWFTKQEWPTTLPGIPA